MCKSKDCQHEKESPIKDWKHRCKYGPDGKRLQPGTVIVGWNDMATTHPHLAKECLDDATKYQAGTKKRLNWKCLKCGWEYPKPGSERAGAGKKCGCCSNKVVVPGKNDLLTTNPELAKECLDDPKKYVAGTGFVLNWKCKTCGYKWAAKGADRISGYGCEPCGYKKVAQILAVKKRISPKRKSLAALRPNLLKWYRGKKDPTKVFAGCSDYVDWLCECCGKIYKATIASKDKFSCCKACGRKRGGETKKIAPFNKSLKFLRPDLASEYRGKQDPSTVYSKAVMKCDWRCGICGEIYQARVCDRTFGGQGHRDCTKSGFKTTVPSAVYLVVRDNSLKIGIANDGSRRLDRHRNRGWSVLDSVSLPGLLAMRLESALKRKIKDKGVPTGKDAFLFSFDGYTEAWPKDHLSARSIRGLCRKLGIDLDAFLAA